MRGCLSVLMLGAVFVGGLVWFGGPPVASALVTTALQGSGLAADKLDVDVTADPPLTLATGRADRVAIHGTGVNWRGVQMASLELTLTGVDLVARTAASAEGRLGGVQLEVDSVPHLLGDVAFRGKAGAARTTIHLDADSVGPVAVAAFATEFGIEPSAASLVAPNIIRVTLGSDTIDGKLAIDVEGSLVATTNGASITIFAPNPSLPVQLTSLAAAPAGVTLNGTFDVAKLLR
jgi:DUF2993 family protein